MHGACVVHVQFLVLRASGGQALGLVRANNNNGKVEQAERRRMMVFFP